MPLTPVFPTAFTFFDGEQHITASNFTVAQFEFATGSNGAITQWLITAAGPIGRLRSYNAVGYTTLDEGLLFIYQPEVYGFNNNTPGSWVAVSGVADSGSTLSLLALALMALGLVARRFQRAAA